MREKKRGLILKEYPLEKAAYSRDHFEREETAMQETQRKKNTVRIVADSTCDLSEELKREYGVCVLPLNIVLGLESFCDGEQIGPEAIYAWAEANKKTPKTAAVAFDRAQQLMRSFQERDEDVVFIGISEAMSTTCNVMRMVKQELEYDRMFVVDSKNLSTGIGLQVLAAADLANEGKTAEEIVAAVEALREKVSASFVVERLDYLAMGGRCSSVAALLGTKLKLNPGIEVHDGTMSAGKKYRGKQEKVILNYVQDREEELLAADPGRVFITHSGVEEAVIGQVREFLESLHHFKRILITRAGGVISSHCGPGTLGVLYVRG